MPDCTNEIEKAVRHAAETGEVLLVANVASRIALACGGAAKDIAEQLTRAAVAARVTLQFGTPA